MYVPAQFATATQADMLDLIAANPLGALVRVGGAGLEADHIPFELAAPTEAAPHGLLRAHVARANPLWQADDAAVLVTAIRLVSGHITSEHRQAARAALGRGVEDTQP